jgi:hypothetical protein
MVQKFESHIEVDQQIVSLLSKSTYQRSFANAIRELVSNSYDADALSVNINIQEEYIEINDDGNGMTAQEFKKYITIAGSKNDSKVTRKYKRKKIGQFGVGFLSIFPFCESMEISTTTENSSDILSAIIPTGDFFVNKTDIQVQEIPIYGNIISNPSEKFKKYTRIKLVKPTYLVEQYFTKVDTKKRDSIIAWDPIRRFKWELQEDLPIDYRSEISVPDELDYDETIGLQVFVNGDQLYRNPFEDSILAKGIETVSGIECKFVFTTSFKSIKPSEARGIKLRVNNVGIGQRSDFFLKRDRGFSRLHWIQGEILISDKIKQYLNISREAFISNPVVEDIIEHFAAKLRDLAMYVETVAEAEKKIDLAVLETKIVGSKSRNDLISENVAKLEKKGFVVIQSANPNLSEPQQSYSIDKDSKVIYYNRTEELERETISIYGQKYELFYGAWDYNNSDEPACRFMINDLSAIEVNQSYPLYKSKAHGNIFLRFSIMLLICRKEMFSKIVNNLTTEFNELT